MNTVFHTFSHYSLILLTENLPPPLSHTQLSVCAIAFIIFALIAVGYVSSCCYSKTTIEPQIVDEKPGADYSQGEKDLEATGEKAKSDEKQKEQRQNSTYLSGFGKGFRGEWPRSDTYRFRNDDERADFMEGYCRGLGTR
jgi:hypothetical protein